MTPQWAPPRNTWNVWKYGVEASLQRKELFSAASTHGCTANHMDRLRAAATFIRLQLRVRPDQPLVTC